MHVHVDAFAQNNVDSDVVVVQAEVVGPVSVTAINSPIDLGQLFAGSTDTVNADGSNASFPTAARFDVAGPSSLSWQMDVSYAALTGPGAETIGISAPAGAANDVCFNDSVGSQAPCSALVDSGSAVVGTAHDGDGTAWVGFVFTVPDPAMAGNYSNASAVTLTMTALLGT